MASKRPMGVTRSLIRLRELLWQACAGWSEHTHDDAPDVEQMHRERVDMAAISAEADAIIAEWSDRPAAPGAAAERMAT